MARALKGGHARPQHVARVHRAWKPSVFSILTAILTLAGVCVLTYPTAASWFSQRDQSRILSNYAAQVDHAVPASRQQIATAERYNSALDAGAILGKNERIPTGNGSMSPGSPRDELPPYDTLLDVNGSGLMARLKIDAINVDLPIYHGTSDETLLKGVGHLEGTSLPVGGPSTHAVLTGHRGLAEATLFTNLNKLAIGDQFTIEVFGEVLTYRVIATEVVDPEDTESLGVVRGKDLVTLVTCTPLGINSQRILVTGERVTPTPDDALKEAGVAPNIPGFPWWGTWILGGIVVMGLYLWRSGISSRGYIDTSSGDTVLQEKSPRMV